MRIPRALIGRQRIQLNEKETVELIRQAQEGNINARNRLLLCNLGLVYAALKRSVEPGLQDDFFPEMVMAAIAAINSWRAGGGAALSSYITRCCTNRLNTLKRFRYSEPPALSLDEPLSGNLAAGHTEEQETRHDIVADQGGLDRQSRIADRLDLCRALSCLNGRELAVVLDYAARVPLRETGARVGVKTKQAVSIMKKRALKKVYQVMLRRERLGKF